MNLPFKTGSILANKYRIDRVLGTGGMGYVLAATHIRLNEPVAIKLLQPSVAAEKGLATRFLQEAKAAAKIRSEHIVRVLDSDLLEDGMPYLVLEYLDGQDLERLVRKFGPLPVPIAVEYVLQVCEALAEAHAAGVVHRDIKPANIFLTQRSDGSPLIKVLDFGISKIISNADGSVDLTKTSEIRGSPLYMAPEQMRSPRAVDARSDIWSLGVSFFFLLTGSFPFVSDNAMDLCAMILRDEPASLLKMRPDVPRGLEKIIAKCLQKKQADRFAHVGELAAHLMEFAPAPARAFAGRALRISVGNVVRASLPSLASLDGDGPISQAPPSMNPSSARPSLVPGMGVTPMDGIALSRQPSGAKWMVAGFAISMLLATVLLLVWHQKRGQSDEDRNAAVNARPSASAWTAPVLSAVEVTPVESAAAKGMVFMEGADAGAMDAGAQDAGVKDAGSSKKPQQSSGGSRRWH